MGQTPYVVSDATTKGTCKGMQKLQYSNCKKRHALSTLPRIGPRTTGGDLAIKLHRFPGDFPRDFLLQECTHKGLILENPKEEPPTSRLCHDKMMYQAKEILIIDLWSFFKANHPDQAGGLNVAAKSQHTAALRSCHILVEGCQT